MSFKYAITISFLTTCTFVSAQEKLVKVNGVHFNVFMKGFDKRAKDTPAIIFENGMGVDLGNWKHVIEEISKSNPVLTYERSGIGKSEKVLKLPTARLVADNLKSILTTLNISPPYILVGHSMGGLYVRAFAGYYPDEIAGLIFIDPADFTETKEQWNSIFRTLGVPEKKIDEMLYDRLYKTSAVDSVNYGPWSEGQVLAELRRTDFSEIKALPVPNVPIWFMVGGKFEVPLDRRSKDFDQVKFFSVRTNVNIERWRDFIYSSSKGGSLVYLSNSGHFIQWDNPKAVIRCIQSVIADAHQAN